MLTFIYFGSIMNKIPIVFTWIGKEPIGRLFLLVRQSANVFSADKIRLCYACAHLIMNLVEPIRARIKVNPSNNLLHGQVCIRDMSLFTV
jgi:hypothetical protein